MRSRKSRPFKIDTVMEAAMTSRLKATQDEFVRHIRNPDDSPLPTQVERRRMTIYNDLLFNNIKGFIEGAFPVLRTLYDDSEWNSLVRRFFKDYQCSSPYFIDISQQFVDFVNQEYLPGPSEPDFLKALVHYEWIELDVSVDSGEVNGRYWQEQTDIISNTMSVELVPSARLLQYDYPVHQISYSYQPTQPSETSSCYLVFRDSHDEVIFKQINLILYTLLLPLTEQPHLTIQSLIERLARQLPEVEIAVLFNQGQALIASLLKEQALAIVQSESP